MPLSPSSMASSIPHHYYSNYTSDHFTTQQGLSSHNNNIINTSILDNTMMWGFQENLMPVFDNYGAFDQIVSLDCDTMSSSRAWIHPNFVEQQDFAVPALLSDCKLGFYGGGIQNFNGRYNNQPPIGHEFVEDQCCGFVEDIKPPPPYPNVARENWVRYDIFSYHRTY
jgi:hypothetical protein